LIEKFYFYVFVKKFLRSFLFFVKKSFNFCKNYFLFFLLKKVFFYFS